ncbi:esterase/lipase family protein [Ideonella sp. BN130291]|uniref:esterase/lipase family protein n=1 Tax=Ideonella sp. BN130291 TaxID=3112940 RepID=UPI002E25D78F|nr:alpha/beta fold hydrolase [Ideonella sp. BN130291]
MLARLQQLIVLTLLLATGAWLAHWAAAGRPLLAVGGALLMVFGYALVLGFEFMVLRLAHGTDPAPRASGFQLLRAWWGEVITAPSVFYWRQPFRSRAEPDHLPAHARGRRGVLLVHGFVCNRGLWNPWMRRLRADGIPFVAVNLEPVFGSIDRYDDIVEAGLRQLEAATGVQPVIVAHSMGGLAVRAWLRRTGNDERVQRVFTIGTPHHGTWLGRYSRTTNTRQMRLGGEWLRQLASAEPPARYQRFTCFYSHCDNIVFPPSTATLPGADNRHIVGWSHVHLAFHPQVFEAVMRLLRS